MGKVARVAGTLPERMRDQANFSIPDFWAEARIQRAESWRSFF
jgi:hypothetical protein